MTASRFVLLATLVVFLVGCGDKNVYQPAPPPTVTVARPLRQTVTHYLEETGTTEAVERVEVRARVKGFLEEIKFADGSAVQKGDTLYVIEPELFQARVDASQAALEVKNAALERAESEKERQERLFREDPGATSERAVVEARTAYNAAVAAVKEAKAALDQAKVDLDYTTVTAPISGRVGKTLVKAGNLVGDGESTHLATIVNYDPIYSNFTISERSLLAAISRNSPEDDDGREPEKTVMYLKRANDDGFPFQGRLDFFDLTVDQSTGTFLARGVFPNPDLDIIPGLFVRIRIPIGVFEDAILVPELAILTDQAGRYVLVVNNENVVQRRIVRIGPKYESFVVIQEGLGPDEWLIIEGVQRARPGSEVNPEQTALTSPAGDAEVVEKRQPEPFEERLPLSEDSETAEEVTETPTD